MKQVEQPLHATKLTRTFRNISRVYNKVMFIVELVLAILFAVMGAVFLPLGIIAVQEGVSETHILFSSAEFGFAEVLAMGTTFTTLGSTYLGVGLGLAIPTIARGIMQKYIEKPTHEQFLALAIVSAVVGLDEFMCAFFVAIFIIEGNKKRRDDRIAAEQ